MEMCECGHPKSDHEQQPRGEGGALVCFHEDEKTHEVECDCMEFKPAEAKAAEA